MFETLQILFSDSVTHPFQNPLVFRIDGRKKKKNPYVLNILSDHSLHFLALTQTWLSHFLLSSCK